MALINTIRKHSGLAVGLVAGSLCLFFVGGDLLRVIASSSNRPTDVGEIAGQKIALQTYQAQLEQLRKQLPPNAGLPDAFVRDRAWEQLIAQTGLQKEYAALGLVVSEDELIDMVQGDHIHPMVRASFQNPETKQFDKQRLVTFLQNLAQMPAAQQAAWRDFETGLADARSGEKFTQLMQHSAFVTAMEAQAQHAAANNTRSVQCLYIPYYSCADEEGTVTDAMLLQYLKAHKNDYQVKESRRVQYLAFPVKPTAEDQQALLQTLQTLKKAFAQAQDARAFAQRNTDGLPARAWLQLTAQQLPQVLALPKASLKKGSVVGPIQEGDVHKLYRVVGRPTKANERYTIAVIEKHLVPGDQACDQAFRKADYCASTVQDANQLATYADQQGLRVRSERAYVNDAQIGGLPQARELVRWLYNEAKVGQVSPVFELGSAYVVAIMTEHFPAGTASLAQVRNEVAFKVSNDRKAKAIMARLQQSAGTTLEEMAAQYGKEARLLTVQELCFDDDTLDSAGMARRVVGTAFALQPGEQATVADDNGVLVVTSAADKAVPLEDAVAHRQRLQQTAKYLLADSIFQAFDDLAQVKDNRYRVY